MAVLYRVEIENHLWLRNDVAPASMAMMASQCLVNFMNQFVWWLQVVASNGDDSPLPAARLGHWPIHA